MSVDHPGWHKRRPGQSLAELAFALPLLALLLFGGIDALQVLMTNYTVNRAARAAAHQAALDGGPSPAVEHTAALILDSGWGTRAHNASVQTSCADACQRFSPVTVTISYRGRVWIPLGIWNDFSARASVTRASEHDRAGPPANCGIPGGPACP